MLHDHGKFYTAFFLHRWSLGLASHCHFEIASAESDGYTQKRLTVRGYLGTLSIGRTMKLVDWSILLNSIQQSKQLSIMCLMIEYAFVRLFVPTRAGITQIGR